MSETTTTSPSPHESNLSGAEVSYQDLLELADGIAEKKDIFAHTEETRTPRLDKNVIPTRQNAYQSISSLLENEVTRKKRKEEIWNDENDLEEFLIDFQNNSPLPQDEKDRIISEVINRTEKSNLPENNNALVPTGVEVVDGELVDEDEGIPKISMDEVINDAEVVDDFPTTPTTSIPRPSRGSRKRRKTQERMIEERRTTKEMIQRADGIHDKEQRIKKLSKIAEDNMSRDGFVDLAIEAAKRIKFSGVHSGRRAKELGKTKKKGDPLEVHEKLLQRIAEANLDNEFGRRAINLQIKPFIREELLEKRYQAIANTVADSVGNETTREEILESEDVLRRAYKDLPRKLRWQADIYIAQQTLDPRWISMFSLRHLNKKRKARKEISKK